MYYNILMNINTHLAEKIKYIVVTKTMLNYLDIMIS